MSALFSVDCEEPKGTIKHDVSLLEMNMPNLYRFWSEARRYPVLFGQKLSNDFGKFCEIFVYKDSHEELQGKGLIWLVDDFVGVFYMTDIYGIDDATVHFSFFDGRIKGRSALVRKMVEHVFEEYSFRRLSAMIPAYTIPQTFKLVEDAGFHLEGRKRKCCPYKDDIFDGYIYGIVEDDIKVGNPYPKNIVNLKSPTHSDHARNKMKVTNGSQN